MSEKEISVFSSRRESLGPTSNPSYFAIPSVFETSSRMHLRLRVGCIWLYKDNRRGVLSSTYVVNRNRNRGNKATIFRLTHKGNHCLFRSPNLAPPVEVTFESFAGNSDYGGFSTITCPHPWGLYAPIAEYSRAASESANVSLRSLQVKR